MDDATTGTSTSDIIDWKKTQEKDTMLPTSRLRTPAYGMGSSSQPW
jgi:hypothetical protein